MQETIVIAGVIDKIPGLVTECGGSVTEKREWVRKLFGWCN